jgi:hypothetical protein
MIERQPFDNIAENLRIVGVGVVNAFDVENSKMYGKTMQLYGIGIRHGDIS